MDFDLLDEVESNTLNAREEALQRLTRGEQVDPRALSALDQYYAQGSGEARKGLRRFASNVASTSEAFVGQLAEPFAPDFARDRLAAATAIANEAAADPTMRAKYNTYQEAAQAGPMGLAQYAAGVFGEGAPSVGLSIAGTLLGRGAGRLAGLSQAGRAAAGALGGTASVLPMEAGETALQIHNDPAAMQATTPWERLGYSGGRGTLNAALEQVVPQALIVPRLLGNAARIGAGLGNAAANVGKLGAAGAIGEFGTEAAQDLTGQYVINRLTGKPYDPQQAIEAGVRGAIVGGVTGGGAGGVQALHDNVVAGGERSVVAARRAGATVAKRFNDILDDPAAFGYNAANTTLDTLANAKEVLGNLGPKVKEGVIKGTHVMERLGNELDASVMRSLGQDGRELYARIAPSLRFMTPTEYRMLRDAIDTSDMRKLGSLASVMQQRGALQFGEIEDWGRRAMEGVRQATAERQQAAGETDRESRDRPFDLNEARKRLTSVEPELAAKFAAMGDAGNESIQVLDYFADHPNLLTTRPQLVQQWNEQHGGDMYDLMARMRRREDVNATDESVEKSPNISPLTRGGENYWNRYADESDWVGGVYTGERSDDGSGIDMEGAVARNTDQRGSMAHAFRDAWGITPTTQFDDSGQPMGVTDEASALTESTPFTPQALVAGMPNAGKEHYSGHVNFTLTDPNGVLSARDIARLIGKRGKGYQRADITDTEAAAIPEDATEYRSVMNPVNLAAVTSGEETRDQFRHFVPQFEEQLEGDTPLKLQAQRMLAALSALDSNGVVIPPDSMPADIRAKVGNQPVTLKANVDLYARLTEDMTPEERRAAVRAADERIGNLNIRSGMSVNRAFKTKHVGASTPERDAVSHLSEAVFGRDVTEAEVAAAKEFLDPEFKDTEGIHDAMLDTLEAMMGPSAATLEREGEIRELQRQLRQPKVPSSKKKAITKQIERLNRPTEEERAAKQEADKEFYREVLKKFEDSGQTFPEQDTPGVVEETKPEKLNRLEREGHAASPIGVADTVQKGTSAREIDKTSNRRGPKLEGQALFGDRRTVPTVGKKTARGEPYRPKLPNEKNPKPTRSVASESHTMVPAEPDMGTSFNPKLGDRVAALVDSGVLKALSNRTMIKRTVNRWSKKYLGGINITVVESDWSHPFLQEYSPTGNGFMTGTIRDGKRAYYIVLRGREGKRPALRVVAHEFGHVLQHEEFYSADAETQQKLMEAYKADKAKNDLRLMMTVDRLLGRDERPESYYENLTAEQLHEEAEKARAELEADTAQEGKAGREAKEYLDYLTSFPEWIAEQFAKHVETNFEEAVDDVKTHSFWLKGLRTLLHFFKNVIQQFAPNTTYSQWLDSLAQDRQPEVPPQSPDEYEEVGPDEQPEPPGYDEEPGGPDDEGTDTGEYFNEGEETPTRRPLDTLTEETPEIKELGFEQYEDVEGSVSVWGDDAHELEQLEDPEEGQFFRVHTYKDGEWVDSADFDTLIEAAQHIRDLRAQKPPSKPPGTPPPPPPGPPPSGPTSADQNRFLEIIRRIMGNRVAVLFGETLSSGAAASFEALPTLDEVRNQRTGLIGMLKKWDSTDAEYREKNGWPKTKDEAKALVKNLERMEQQLLTDKAVRGVIRVATNREQQAGLAEHEAFHAAFTIFFEANPETRRIVTTAVTRGPVNRRLRAYFKDQPEVIAAISPETNPTGYAEEAAAYAFQVYLNDRQALQIGAQLQGFFEKVKTFLRKLLGMHTYEERAKQIFDELNSGITSDKGVNPQQRIMDANRDGSLFSEHAQKMARDIVGLAKSATDYLLSSTYDRMVETANPMLEQVARLGYNITGDTGDGYIQLMRTKDHKNQTQLAHIFKDTTPEERAEIQMHAVMGTDPIDPKLRSVLNQAREWLKAQYEYQKAAGVELNNAGARYWPLSWDAKKVLEDRDGFLKMLEDNYAEQLQTLKITPNTVWEQIAEEIDRGLNLRDVMGKNGEPVSQHTNTRKLAFISREHRAPYMSDDAGTVLMEYGKQSARQTEYVRAYGHNGEKLERLLTEAATVYGATKEQIKMANDYVAGLLGNKEIGMSRELKDAYGVLTVYQNIRLLPLSVFSSLVDPMGIAIRTNSPGAAWDTFTYSLKNLFRDWKKDYTPDQLETIATDLGVIVPAGMALATDARYTGITLSGKTREINEAFFKINLLNGWIRNNHIMGTQAGMKFLERLKAGFFKDEQNERYLEELGLTADDIEMASDRIAIYANEFSGTPEEQAKKAEKIGQAINKIVRQSLIQPSAAEMPSWMSNPYLAPIAHLKSFVWGFQKTITERVMHEAKNGNLSPIYYAAAYVPFMIGADFLKDLLGNAGEVPDYKKNWGIADYTWHGVERSGFTGTGQFFLDAKSDMYRGGAGFESLEGPSLEQATKFMRSVNSSEKLGNWMVDALPANQLYDQWL